MLAHGPPPTEALGDEDQANGGISGAETEILYAVVSALLVLFAGLMSGLSLGLMSVDKVDLEVLKASGSDREKKCARSIMPVVDNHHFTLVTLLLCNAVALEALPIFLDRLTDPVTAIILSVTVVLLVGEIIPQAVCAKHGLIVGAYFAWVVQGLRIITAPVSWPLAKLLDWLMGPDKTVLFKRAELKALVSLHDRDRGLGGRLSKDEIDVIIGALDMEKKTAKEGMTSWENVYMLPEDAVLDEKTLREILAKGHSRIPVHRPGNRKAIRGLILVKELLLTSTTKGAKVSDCNLRDLPCLPHEMPMYRALEVFRECRIHMAVLCQSEAGDGTGDDPAGKSAALGEPLGIITLEDVIEELLQEEIVDETDQFVDNSQTVAVKSARRFSRLPSKHLVYFPRTRSSSSTRSSSRFRSMDSMGGTTAVLIGEDNMRTPLLLSVDGSSNFTSSASEAANMDASNL